ncbi:MAG: DUF2085 domain-containing protein [Candidatus Helarchaeota archaeon]|nr:DUF2085 domain-containing protein [Candidatus Helarchaeota archaeon]
MKVKDFFFLLLAHHPRDDLSHTVRVPIGKREIYLCARCTALYSSLAIALILFTYVIDLVLLPFWVTLIVALAFGIPIILSWGKQTITGRDNSNRTRISTGIGGGIGLAMLFYLPTPLREFFIFGIFSVVFAILYFGKIRRYKKSSLEVQQSNLQT